MLQEKIAIGIVFIVFVMLILKFYREFMATYFSKWLLKKGSVKLAMKVRKHASPQGGCSSCKA